MGAMDFEEAVEYAEKFLEDRHDTIELESGELEGNVWVLEFDVGFLSNQVKEVKVDAETGKILGYRDVTED